MVYNLEVEKISSLFITYYVLCVWEISFVTDVKFKRCVMKYKNRKCPQNPALTVIEHIGPWMPKIQCLTWLEEERKWDNLRIWHCLYLPDCSNWILSLHLNPKFIFRSNWHWASDRKEKKKKIKGMYRKTGT